MNRLSRQLVIGALDSLGLALTDRGHHWTAGERAIYEQATAILLATRSRPRR